MRFTSRVNTGQFYKFLFENYGTTADIIGMLPGLTTAWKIERKVMDWFGKQVTLIKFSDGKQMVMVKVDNMKYQVVDQDVKDRYVLDVIDQYLTTEFGIQRF